MHYGTEFRFEVVDASTDICVGTVLLSTQGLLQWRRDEIASSRNLMFSLDTQPNIKPKKKRAIFELRTGVKSGFGLDFYNAGTVGSGTRAGTSNTMTFIFSICFLLIRFIFFFRVNNWLD